MDDAALVAAAKFERDWRATRYPARIAAGESDAEAATVDYQCWCIIADWFETDRFTSFPGVSWPECELAAESALVGVTAKCDRLFNAADVKAGEYEAACARRAGLWAIHRQVQLRRQTIDAINAAFRARRQQELAA